MTSSPPIVVVGPGRCGTSAVAGILRKLGVFMGEQFVPASASNPYGHHEDVEFHDLNIARIKGVIQAHTWRRAVGRLMDARERGSLPWGWKDPRTCHLLHEYLRIEPEARVIRCLRDIDDVAQSMAKAYGWDLHRATITAETREWLLDKWLRRAVPYPPQFTILWEDLFSDTERVVRQLAKFCILTPSEEKIANAVKSIRR